MRCVLIACSFSFFLPFNDDNSNNDDRIMMKFNPVFMDSIKLFLFYHVTNLQADIIIIFYCYCPASLRRQQKRD